MKKCSRCTNSATRHITEIENDEVNVLHLCESCTKSYLSGEPAETDDVPDVVQESGSFSADEDLGEIDQKTCPNCGITFREFRKRGRLGCPHDYVVFNEELKPLLENLHNDTEHHGKLPNRAPSATQRHSSLIRLRNQLADAIDGEEYEDAARLRDEISQLEADIQAESDSA